jgi:hypothetical protein
MFERLIMPVAMLVTIPAAAEETIVFSGNPESRVVSTKSATERFGLSPSESSEYELKITTSDGKYFWASREDVEVFPIQSGAFLYFTSSASGYVKISYLENPPAYVEHINQFLDTYTYWGAGTLVLPNE